MCGIQFKTQLNHFKASIRWLMHGNTVTISKKELTDIRAQIVAISKSQAIIEFNLDGYVINANDNFLRMFDYTLDEIMHQHHRMFVEPSERSTAAYIHLWQKLSRGEFDQGQYKRMNKHWLDVWLEATYNPIFDVNGKPYKIVKYATDVTERKRKVADFSGQVAAISKSLAVVEFGLDGYVITANDNFLRIFGYTLDEIVDQHHHIFVDITELDSQEYKQLWVKLGDGKFAQGQYKRLRKDGCTIWLEVSYNPILDESGKPYKVVKYATDVTARVEAADTMAEAVLQTQVILKAAESGDLSKRIPVDNKDGLILDLCVGVNALVDNVQLLSNSDPLTGLANRRHFDQFVAKEWPRAMRKKSAISILMIDADHFKHYNDTYGHLEGDQCLRIVSEAIKTFQRRPTDLAVRFGGEEFLLLLAETALDDAVLIAEQLRAAISLLDLGNHKKITVSIGVYAAIPNAENSVLDLIKGADDCVYQAKANGRNRVEFS